MSTYINTSKPNQRPDFSDCPAAVTEFLNYTLTIRGLSVRTVNGYYIDLRTFFKYLVLHRGLVPDDTVLSEIAIDELDMDFIRKIDKAEIYDFLFYITKERDNAAATRSRGGRGRRQYADRCRWAWRCRWRHRGPREDDLQRMILRNILKIRARRRLLRRAASRPDGHTVLAHRL